MSWRRHRPEEIFEKLEKADALQRRGLSAADIAKSIAVTEATYFRWRRRFGVLKGEQIRRLMELEAENARLRRAIEEMEGPSLEALTRGRKRKSADSADWLRAPTGA